MFELIKLPYKSLAPVISDQTLSFHYGKHLQAYVDNLNKLLPGSGLDGKSLEDIVVLASEASGGLMGSIFNNAGQVLNHNLYFTQFCHFDQAKRAEKSALIAQIVKQWGSLDAFKEEFEAKGVGLFGSGWVWLAAKEDGELVILQCPGADNPICHFERSPKGEVEKSLRPLLTFDVWEHAYYLDYQNRRAAHLQALWPLVNWKVIEERYTK
ncbi:MAG: superoxide dismutase [Bacteroidales bacterium]|nr:superoxide dismutase [Bacteroidales bacterium]